MKSPRIYLTLDNTFAQKRWGLPSEWMPIIRDLGVFCVEAGTDNECDPFLTGSELLDDWLKQTLDASEKTGVRVANFYSGHATYTVLGLGHPDKRIRRRYLDGWLKPVSKLAGRLNAGMGFYTQAFPFSVLQDPSLYRTANEDLCSSLAELADFCGETGCRTAGVEQMYTPHQVPWTIAGTQKLLRQINEKCTRPFYTTVDVGHQCAQRKFMRPSAGLIKEYLRKTREGAAKDAPWLGPQAADRLFDEALKLSGAAEDKAIGRMEEAMERYPYLFAEYVDGDTYAWLETLACYSPIIHLQQTDGVVSGHHPFTREYNEKGIITGERVLSAIRQAYLREPEDGMPEKCGEIYLTLEIFSGTSDKYRDILSRLAETVAYWRKFIPKDGMTLDELPDAHI